MTGSLWDDILHGERPFLAGSERVCTAAVAEEEARFGSVPAMRALRELHLIAGLHRQQ